jgi:hypothetical protein
VPITHREERVGSEDGEERIAGAELPAERIEGVDGVV